MNTEKEKTMPQSEPVKRKRRKVTINLWDDNIDEAHSMSHGNIYKSEYQVFIADVLDEALKNKMLILKVLQKKEASK